ncbi:Acetolactate synthase small subunit [Lachnospiraceae bacterium TWA4]|nr:Acetolactate synthase small subunit [Lachnospiraceae bacterium TWA4]
MAGLFSRRGFSIDSITAGKTDDPRLSRLTIVSSGDEDSLDQIKKQVMKLRDVIQIRELPLEQSVTRELVLIKVEAPATTRPQIISIVDIFRAKIIDVASESLIIELTGDQSKINAFIELLSSYNILKVARTGITGLPRGMAESTEVYNRKFN